MRRSTKLGSLVGVFATLAFTISGSANAQTARGFAVNRFEPSERGSEWFANESLDLRGHGRFAAGVVADYSYRSLVHFAPDGDVQNSIVRNSWVAHAGGSAVLWNRLRLGVNLPVVAFIDGRGGTLGGTYYPSPPNGQAIGDLRLGGDVRIAGQYGTPFVVAGGLHAWLPTGSKDAYASDGYVRLTPRAMVAGDIGMLTYAARMGLQIRPRSEQFAGSPIGSEWNFGLAAGLRAADKKLVVGPEIFGSTVVTDGDELFQARTTPLEGILGAHYLFADQWRVGGGVGAGLTRGYGSPVVRTLISLEWAPQPKKEPKKPDDRDGDGIADMDDACPTIPGPSRADPRAHGCPDTDGDGIADPLDACPNEPGEASTDPQQHGCPKDTDGDGIPDKSDACPNEPGERTGDPKTNGCPGDRDKDGIPNEQDACPDEPGVTTDDPKTNGCPDPDRDKDGIPNDVDACPDAPGKTDPDPKRNGCPQALVEGSVIKILDQVRFKTGSAEIQENAESKEVLEAVLEVMKQHSEIKKVRVEGHTDNVGGAAFNKKLSERRAASVVKWLTKHGVDKDRLSSEGVGLERPLATNDTPEGRKLNRRVEFHIVERDEGGTPPAPPGAPSAPAPEKKP